MKFLAATAGGYVSVMSAVRFGTVSTSAMHPDTMNILPYVATRAMTMISLMQAALPIGSAGHLASH